MREKPVEKKSSESDERVSRRDFLEQGLTAGAAILAGTLLPGDASEASPRLPQEPDAWAGITPDPVHSQMGVWVRVDTLMKQDIPHPDPYTYLGTKGTGLVISKRFHRFWLYKEGQLIGTVGPVGTARTSSIDPTTQKPYETPRGAFTVTRKEGSDYMSGQYPDADGEPNMKWATFFIRGVATHGSKNFRAFDENMFLHLDSSHGCVNVTDEDAESINKTLAVGDPVVVLP